MHLAINASTEKYLYIAIPERTVFTSGIPEPSASGEINRPTDVAIKSNRTADATHRRKFIKGVDELHSIARSVIPDMTHKSIMNRMTMGYYFNLLVTTREKNNMNNHSLGFVIVMYFEIV
jgi:hypothetical protein